MKGTMFKNRQAFSVMEYVVLLVLVVSAMITFRLYLQRGYQGQMRKAGEGFAFGRQYDPNKTRHCAYDAMVNGWYSTACYDHVFAKAKCTQEVDMEAGCSGNMAQICNSEKRCDRSCCIYRAQNACRAPCKEIDR